MSLTNKQKQDIFDLVFSRTAGRASMRLVDDLKKQGLTENNLFVRGEPVIISASTVKNILWQTNSQQVDFASTENGRGIVTGPYQGSNTSEMWRMVFTPYSPSPQRIHITQLRYPNS